MKNKIQDFVNKIYKGVKKNKNINMQKEELYQNLMDKVADLINEGLNEEDAINKVINDFGSVDEVRNELGIYVKNRKMLEKIKTIIIFIGIFTLIGSLIYIKYNQMGTENNYNGFGSKDDPYIIRNVRDLKKMEEKPNSYYILNNDIDLNEVDWKSIEYFNGIIDGNDYQLINLDSPFINELGEEGIIKNVHLKDADLSYKINNNPDVPYNTGDIGILVNQNYGDIYNTSVRGWISVENHDKDICLMLGLMVGKNVGTITNSYALGSVLLDNPEEGYNCWASIGGIAGQNYGTIEDVYNDVLIKGNAHVIAGGITSLNTGIYDYDTGIINRTISYGDIKTNTAVAGIVLDNGARGKVENSFSMVSLESEICVGAVFLHNFGEVNNNYRLNNAKLEGKEECIVDSENKFSPDQLRNLMFDDPGFRNKWEFNDKPKVKKRNNKDTLVAYQE